MAVYARELHALVEYKYQSEMLLFCPLHPRFTQTTVRRLWLGALRDKTLAISSKETSTSRGSIESAAIQAKCEGGV